MDSLRSQLVPKRKALRSLKFCDMKLDARDVQALLIATIIPTVQGNKVIPDAPGNVDGLVQPSVSLCVIELKGVGPHLFFCSSMYLSTVFSEMCPTDSQ